TNYFPGTTEALDEVVAAGDELTGVFANQMTEGGKSVPVTPAWGKIEGATTNDTLLGDILGGTPVQDAADVAAAEMDGFFAERGRRRSTASTGGTLRRASPAAPSR